MSAMIEIDPKQARALAYVGKDTHNSNLQITQVEGWGLDVLAPDAAKRWRIEVGGEVEERSLHAFPCRGRRRPGGSRAGSRTPALGDVLAGGAPA